jgi:hypothetical protein
MTQTVRHDERRQGQPRLLMHLRLARVLVAVLSLLVLTVSWTLPARVLAHAAPAFPPVFDPGPCIEVIDRAQQATVRIGYRVPVDDTLLTQGDIPLPDSLTHQFFALRGSVLFEGFAPELWTLAADAPDATVLPLWISRADVVRAQQSSDAQTLGYDLSSITPDDILETKSPLSGRWLRITQDDERVPITSDQSLSGFTWNIRDVEPGVYTLAAYIFSPPYNGWEVREGLISVVDADAVPAAVIERIQESLFAGQGRRVRTCLEVPAGTRMRSYFRVEEREELGWMPWAEERPVESGSLEQCFHPPEGLSGTVRLRVDLIAPSGTGTSFYSPDTLQVLNGSLPCQDGASICCAAGPAETPLSSTDASDRASSDAESRDHGPAASKAKPKADGGCAIAIPNPDSGSGALGAFGLLASVAIAARSRKRTRRVDWSRAAVLSGVSGRPNAD